MADRPYRVIFKALPIIVHASSEQQAVEKAIAYLRQPDSGRIIVESEPQKDANP